MATSPMESLSSGFIINIELFFITLLLALPLGLVITFCSMSKFKPLKWLSRTFVWIIRGTPLMLQLFVVLYAPGLLFSMPMNSRFTASTGHAEKLRRRQHRNAQISGLGQLAAGIFSADQIIRLLGHRAAGMGAQ